MHESVCECVICRCREVAKRYAHTHTHTHSHTHTKREREKDRQTDRQRERGERRDRPMKILTNRRVAKQMKEIKYQATAKSRVTLMAADIISDLNSNKHTHTHTSSDVHIHQITNKSKKAKTIHCILVQSHRAQEYTHTRTHAHTHAHTYISTIYIAITARYTHHASPTNI